MSKQCFAASLMAIGLSWLAGAPCAAQAVRVVDKPGDGQWTVSFSRKDGPNTFELDTFCKTKAEALQEAERLKAWSNGMAADSSWRLAVILIEGEDARDPGRPRGNEVPRVRDPLDTVANLNQRTRELWRDTDETLRKVLENSKQDVDHAAKRVKELKEYLVRNVDKLNDDNFKQINGLIDEYNGKVDRYRAGPGGESFSLYPRMNPVTPQSMQKVKKWQQAKAEQQLLAAGKKVLDSEKSRIDRERDALLQEGRRLQEAEAELQRLRQRASNETANAGPPYTVYTWTTDTVDTGRLYPTQDRPQTLSQAQEIARTQDTAAGTFSPQRWRPSYILDRVGNDVTHATEVLTARVDRAELTGHEEDLRRREAEFQRRLQKYRRNLVGSYNQRLSNHLRDVRSHASDVNALSQ